MIAVVLIAGGIGLFLALAGQVTAGGMQDLDEQILLALHDQLSTRPYWVQVAVRDLTGLAGGAILFLLTTVVSLYLLFQRKLGTVLLLLAAVLGGVFLTDILKGFFLRPRPDLVPHLTEVTSTSFPSGHAVYVAATYLTLGAMLVRAHNQDRMKALFLITALLITFLVGASRVYLGVHWPSDVLGGWTVGAVWAIFCWTITRWLQRGDAVE